MPVCKCIANSTKLPCRRLAEPGRFFCFQHTHCKHPVVSSGKTYFDLKDFSLLSEESKLAPLSPQKNKMFYLQDRTFTYDKYIIFLKNDTEMQPRASTAKINFKIYKITDEERYNMGQIQFELNREKKELYLSNFRNYLESSPGIMRRILCEILKYFYDENLWRGLVTLLAWGSGPKNFSLKQDFPATTNESILELAKYYAKYFGFKKKT